LLPQCIWNGIKADVKTVIHIQLPENIENYYQEADLAEMRKALR
jgi:hypothetical protein